MDFFWNKLELFIVIVLTLTTKWFMTEEPVSENEAPLSRKMRHRRTFGGIIAGAICAYYGPEIIIQYVNWIDSDVMIPLTIVMAITGEHLFRALITKVPTWIDLFVKTRIDRS